MVAALLEGTECPATHFSLYYNGICFKYIPLANNYSPTNPNELKFGKDS